MATDAFQAAYPQESTVVSQQGRYIRLLLATRRSEDTFLLGKHLAAELRVTVSDAVSVADLLASLDNPETRYDAILLDADLQGDTIPQNTDLPGNTATLETLKATLARAGHVPVLVLSRSTDKELEEATLDFGAEAFLVLGQDGEETIMRAVRRAAKRQAQVGGLPEAISYPPILDSVSDAVFLLDMNLRCIRSNSTAYKMLGYSRQELEGQDIFALLIPGETGASILERGELKIGMPLPVEQLLMDKSSRLVEAEIQITPADGYLQMVVHDLTTLRQLEGELRRRTAIYEAIMQAQGDLGEATLVTEGTRAVYANDRFTAMVGYSPEELFAMPSIGALVAEASRDAYSSMVAKWNAGIALDTSFELQLNKKDGTNVSVEAATRPITIDGKVHRISAMRDLTERRQVEEQLMETVARHRFLVEQAPEGIVVLDRTGAFVEANRGACESLGYTAEELYKLNIRNVLSAEHRRQIAKSANHPDGTGAAFTECMLKRKDGSWFPVEISTGVVSGGRLQVIARDITKRKQAEAALRESEERAKLVISALKEGVVLLDANGTVNTANEGAARILGIPLDELVGRRSTDQIWRTIRENGTPLPESQHPSIITLRTGVACNNVTIGIYRPDGSLAWVTVNAQPLCREGETSPYAVVTSLFDITEQKAAERALLHERYLLRTLMDNLPDSIYFKDTQSRFTNMSTALAKRLDLDSPEQGVGMSDFDFFTRQHAQSAFDDEQEVMRTGLPVIAKEERETWEDGREKWVSTTKMPLRGLDGELLGTFGMSRDITERKLAEQELQQERAYVEMLKTVAVASNEAESLEAAVQVCLDTVCALTGMPVGHYYTVCCTDSCTPVSTRIWHIDEPEKYRVFKDITETTDMKDRVSLPGTVISTRRPAWISDIRNDDAFLRKEQGMVSEVNSGFAFPVTLNKEVLGVLEFFSGDLLEPNPALLEVMSHIGTQLGRVAERKQAEQSLTDSEALVRLFVEHTPAAVAMLDKDMRYIITSRRWLKDYGMEDTDITGKSHYEIFPHIPANWKDIHARCLAGSVERCDEDAFTTANGEQIWMEWEVRPWYNKTKEVGGLIMFTNIITERKRHEEALRESEMKLRAIIEHTTNNIFIKDREGVYLLINPAGARLFNLTPEEIVGKTDVELYGAAAIDAVADIDRDILATGQTRHYERTWVVGGTEHVFLTTKFPYLSHSGEVLGIVGISHDLTDRKRAEEVLRKQHEELALLYETTLGVINRLDLNSLLQALVSRAGALMGTPHGYIYLKEPGVEEMVVRVGTGRFAANTGLRVRRGEGLSGRVWDTGQPLAIDNYAAWSGARPGFEQLHAMLAIPVRTGAEVVGVIGLAYPDEQHQIGWDDIARLSRFGQLASLALDNAQLYAAAQQELVVRKRTEEELQAFAAKLESSNRELQDFAYVASHDLQEPLRKITVFGDRLKTKYEAELGEQGRDYLERMQNASIRMQALINDLLSYSRVTTKAQPFEMVDLAEIANGVLSDLEVRIEQTGGRVEISNMPCIDADPTQMRQLLQNLIGNALKFSRSGVPPVVQVSGKILRDGNRVNPTGLLSGKYCQIIVSDNGIGFEQKYTERIFGVFQRLHGRNQYEGTGVGLAVCRKIVERHNGSITARSDVGQGATFVVTLPTEQPKTEELL